MITFVTKIESIDKENLEWIEDISKNYVPTVSFSIEFDEVYEEYSVTYCSTDIRTIQTVTSYIINKLMCVKQLNTCLELSKKKRYNFAYLLRTLHIKIRAWVSKICSILNI